MEDSITILRGIKDRYEVHHGVRIRDDALISAAVLSSRYITNRFLPDKAIDLVDEAASRLKMEIESQPVALDRLERKILQIQIEKQSLSRENDKASLERLENINRELGQSHLRSGFSEAPVAEREGRHRGDTFPQTGDRGPERAGSGLREGREPSGSRGNQARKNAPGPAES